MISIFIDNNRFMKREGRFLTWLIILSFVFQVGCVHKTAVLPEAERQKLGSIGVISAGYSPKFEVQKPAKGGFAGFGRGATRGAAKGFALPLSAGGGGGGGDFAGLAAIFVLGVAVVCGTVGGLVSGVSGAAEALPAAEVEAAEAALNKAIKQQNMQEKIRDRVLQLSKYWPRYQISPLIEKGPQTPNEKLSYAFLSDKGIDTVLEMAIRNFGLSGNWEVNPTLSFFMNVDVRLVRVKDGTDSYNHTFTYVSSDYSFTEWAKDDSLLFVQEMENSFETLALQIVNNLFVITTTKQQKEADSEQKIKDVKPLWQ